MATKTAPTALSAMLIERREQLGISQEVAAVQIGTNRNTYTAWEKGEGTPEKLKWVRPLASWLDVPTYRVAAALGILGDGEVEVLRDAMGSYLAAAA